MLVLSRQPGESVLLPDVGVAVRVLNVKGTTVRLGVEAPDGLTILRLKVIRGDLSSRALQG
jgi:carbon storage regulator